MTSWNNVIAGLDPAIHLLELMDTHIKLACDDPESWQFSCA